MGFFNRNNSNKILDKKPSLTNKEVEAINTLIQDVASTLDLDQVLQRSTDAIVNVLNLHGCILFLIDTSNKYVYTKTMAQSNYSKTALKILKIDNMLDKLKVELSQLNNLVVDCIVNDRNNTSNNLSDFTLGVLDSQLVEVIQLATFTGNAVAVPVKYKNENVGALLITKRNRNEDFQKELPIIQIYSTQIGIAIANASFFDESKKQIIQLTKKNEELSSLYNLTAKVSSSLDPLKVAQDAVDSLPQGKLMIGAIIALFNKDREYIYPLAASRNQLSYAVDKLIGDISQYGLHLSDPMAENNLVMRAFTTGKSVSSADLADFLVPAVNKRFVKPIAELLQIKGVTVYPLIIRNQVIGTLSFLIKEKEVTEIDANENQLLQTYTNQIAIALENARLFEESETTKAELQSTIKQLETARKHERDMIDIMGHELRTPMSILRNSLLIMDTQMKIKPPDLLEKIHKYIEIGVEAARREVSLIETLLSATKTDGKGFQLIFESIDYNDMINNAMIAFQRQADIKGLKFEYIRPEKPVVIYSDRTRIQEIVDNFINNAVKYTLTGSVIVRVYEKEGIGYFTVQDTGVGISEEDLKKLGTKFFRARQYLDDKPKENLSPEKLEIIRPGGTGLGLYVTFNLIKLLDGKLILESKVREGSTFGAGFPIYQGQAPAQIEKKVEQFEQGV